jgi:hypothetical protein
MDYRLKENRQIYNDKLYLLNLKYGIMPGLVYFYMPRLAALKSWHMEDKLWFAFINGMTQNPLTSMRIYREFPEVPVYPLERERFEEWFNESWAGLQFDTDRRHQKRDTVKAVETYAALVNEFGSQERMFSDFNHNWKFVRENYYGFGRLSTWSYLEYVMIMGLGTDASAFYFDELDGSRSHRNGALFLFGYDDQVSDKRTPQGKHDKYDNFEKMCGWLEEACSSTVERLKAVDPQSSRFTFESQLCQFKNHFFGRRYPGVYSDMAHERLKWYEDKHGADELTKLFYEMREDLPAWLRAESEVKSIPSKQKAGLFPATGVPYRAEHFL